MDDECVEELGRPISSFKVSELRDELTKRSLIKTGNKKELVDRLRIAIQRQSSSSQQNEQDQQQQQQQQLHASYQQQLAFQNASPQFLNTGAAAAAVALQQNQAAAYQQQLNQIQPQAAQLANAYNVPISQQQPIMQQLDLQQQLLDYQNQVNLVSSDLQQQQQQQKFYDAPATNQEPPPIDMRVPQQNQPHKEETEQSIDLTNNEKQNVQQNDIITQSDEQDKQPEGVKEGSKTHQESRDNLSSSKEAETMIENTLSKEEPTTANNTIQESNVPESDYPSKESASPAKDAGSGDVSSNVETQPEDNLDADAKEITDETSKKQHDSEAQIQSFSLKRGAPERSSSAKEKRRKWSSKNPVPTEIPQTTETAQVGVFSGGISSQKLQELIVEKQLDVTAKNDDDSGADIGAESKTLSKSTSENTNAQVDENLKDPVTSTDDETYDDKKSSENDTTIAAQTESKSKSSDQVAEIEPTNILLVKNLVRPFTITQLKEVLTKHGSMDEEKFWTDKVKSKCCVLYESVEVAKLTKESLHGQQWPTSNPKTLDVTFITEEALIDYQNSEQAKQNKSSIPTDAVENGGNTNEPKSITDRLGQKMGETGEATGSDQVKKRLADRTSGEFTKSSNVNRDGDTSKPQELDDLFNKTKAVPHLFWLPLDDNQADVRQKERDEREARSKELALKRRSPPRRRSPIRHRSPLRHRSPPGRRSPMRKRSRSPVYRRSPPRYHSPMLRRSPMRRRSPHNRNSPPRRRSPGRVRRSSAHRSPQGGRSSPNRRSPHRRSPIRRSPGPIRRSPGPGTGSIRRSPIRRSPGLVRRSPGLVRRSPGQRRSPGPIKRSPGTMRRSPGPIRRSPGPIKRSPGQIRRSPIRRSPLLIRRSPVRGSPQAGIRNSPQRNRSPRRQRTPTRYMSPPERMLGGFASEQRRLERSRF